ncbi:MAG: MFS transporter [Candidatus Rokubacteria bacterium]|nr:MFS transporter [Candidatus Rokubacteria bacterium]
MTLRGPWVIALAMFFGSFSWSFVYVSLPFHIQAISTLDPAATLRWTGWIVGIASLVTVVTAPLGGRVIGGRDPILFYSIVQFFQGVCFMSMALARTLPELFLSRLILGAAGASSTFAFMVSGQEESPTAVRRHVAVVQSAMTVGQLVGPLVGAIAAARLGFRASFVVGGVIIIACGGLVLLVTPRARPAERVAPPERRARPRDVVAVGMIVLGASIQVFFLTSVLPQVLPPLGVSGRDTLTTGGLLMFLSGAGAALGSMLAPRLSDLFPERRLLVALLVGSSCLLAALAPLASLPIYAVIRFLQVLLVAPVFPIVVSRIAPHAGGQAIGLLNSARIGAAFAGPVVATTLLAWVPLWTVYLVLAVIGLACVPFALMRGPGEARSRG